MVKKLRCSAPLGPISRAHTRVRECALHQMAKSKQLHVRTWRNELSSTAAGDGRGGAAALEDGLVVSYKDERVPAPGPTGEHPML